MAVCEGKLQRRCWSSVRYAGMNKLPRRLFTRLGARRCQPRWAVQGRRFSLPPTPPLMPPPPPPPVPSKPAAAAANRRHFWRKHWSRAAGPEIDTSFRAGDYLILGAPPMPQPSIISDVCIAGLPAAICAALALSQKYDDFCEFDASTGLISFPIVATASAVEPCD